MIGLGLLSSKTLVVSRGEFECPNCRTSRQFAHKERYRRRLMVFVPILGDLIEEYVECDTCRARSPVAVLRQKIHASTEQVLEGLKAQLSDGVPIEEAETKLAEAGMAIGQIKQFISVAAGIGRRQCVACKLTYRSNVSHCRKCNQELPGSSTLVTRR